MSIRCSIFLLLSAMFPGISSAADVTFSINGRSATLPDSTPAVIDGELMTLADLASRPNGLQARWQESPTGQEGVGAVPVFSYTLIGPVTDTAPLSVLGQPVTITADTELFGVNLPTNLPLGTPMVVAGLVDANGSVLATLVERLGAPGARFLLTGAVLEVGATPGNFRVGSQWVNTNVPIGDCAQPQPQIGEYVSLRADAVPGFAPGDTLTTVTDGACIAPVPAGTPGATGFVSGLVSNVLDGSTFVLGALEVSVSPSTVFEFGTAIDLEPGVGVTVDGAYVDADHFSADVVEFLRPVVRFEAPVAPGEVIPGTRISLLGVPVLWSAQVRDEDGILENGLAQSQQVEVRGYIDGAGQAFATRVRDRGAPDNQDVRVRGPVESLAPPMLRIQNQNIDTTGITFEDEFGTPMTSQQFFSVVALGDIVDVSGAAYDAQQSLLTGGALVWAGFFNVPPRPIEGVGGTGNILSGTASGYSRVGPLFKSGFE